MRADVNIERNADTAAATEQATDAYLMDMATVGFEKSQDIVASEATDTGTLLQSGFPPEERPDGSVTWGYNADYARPVDQGSRPHWPPIEPLLGWARRVLGDESAAYAVQQKIAEEGTDPVEYIARSVETMRAWASSHDAGDYVVDRL